MSRAKSLIDLLSAVEAGRVGQFQNLDSQFGHGNGIIAKRAYNGSLDAAKALHDAVLPGWVGSFATGGFARVAKGGRVLTVMECHHLDNSPARAWLICILRALIAQAMP